MIKAAAKFSCAVGQRERDATVALVHENLETSDARAPLWLAGINRQGGAHQRSKRLLCPPEAHKRLVTFGSSLGHNRNGGSKQQRG
jgi:hypothetical protein